ncbi:hypothetical protein G4B88_025375 [Cannabis sativa]|uniref:Uncharacterized protein n=1 Tax=Cannabis sativa TaxID=3483 RepID=A0A7J6HSZ0_CANSA|nr:hypothetical protein G4B88_025375 [Cannabis sativa]
MRSKGKKTEVEYNSWGQAVSDGAEKLRSEIVHLFITGTKMKSYVLSVNGDRWREFKSNLTNFIYTHKDDNP